MKPYIHKPESAKGLARVNVCSNSVLSPQSSQLISPSVLSVPSVVDLRTSSNPRPRTPPTPPNHPKTPRHFNISTRHRPKPSAISKISIPTPKTFGHFNFSKHNFYSTRTRVISNSVHTGSHSFTLVHNKKNFQPSALSSSLCPLWLTEI